MKNVCIFYFSGTGMTQHVVHTMKEAFESRRVCVDCFRIEDASLDRIRLEAYDAAGFAYPVHSFNAPKLVVRFVKRLPQVKDLPTFVISTSGEYSPLNFSSSDLLIQTLGMKGFCIFYDRQFTMPSNFALRYDDAKAARLVAEADAQVPDAVREIVDEVPRRQKERGISKTLAVAGRVEWIGAPLFGKLFYANKACIRCGACVQCCPNRNIRLTEKSAGFGWRCGLCLRCVYRCPNHAIRIRKPFAGIRVDPWYPPAVLQGTRKGN